MYDVCNWLFVAAVGRGRGRRLDYTSSNCLHSGTTMTTTTKVAFSGRPPLLHLQLDCSGRLRLRLSFPMVNGDQGERHVRLLACAMCGIWPS